MLCRICGNSENNKTHTFYEMMFGTREFFIYYECSGCGCFQIAEIPAKMEEHYPSNYYSQNTAIFNLFKNPITKIVLNLRNGYGVFSKNSIGKLFYEIKSRGSLGSLSKIGLTKDSRILDVGCGNGYDLYALKEIGFKNLLGIDRYIKEDIKYDNGLIVLKKELKELEGYWDVIMFHQVLEHMPNPVEILQQAYRLLSKDGVCIVRVPIIPCYAWEHYGINWRDLDAPRHFYIYSIKSVKILAEKSNFILDLNKVYHDSTEFQLLGSEQYVKGIPWESPQSAKNSLLRLILSIPDIVKFKLKAKKLNFEKKGSQAAFYLIRK